MTTDLLDLAAARSLAESGVARQVRVAAHLSLAEVASEIGIAVSTLSRWERQERRPRGAAAVRYGRLLRELLNGART